MPRLAILTYHAVISTPLAVPDWCFLDADMFRWQMDAVARTGRVSFLSAAVEPLIAGEGAGPAIAVTFDDGFMNNFTVAFPTLQALQIPATIFVTTGLLDTNDTQWFCKINRAVTRTRLPSFTWLGESYDLSSVDSRADASARLQQRLKEYPHDELLRRLQAMCEALGDEVNAPVPVDSPYAILNTATMRAMSESGLVEFGAHTHQHAILSRLPVDEQRSEILESVATVRTAGVRAAEVFAYPNGRPQDYGPDAIEILHSAGIRAAVTAIHRANDDTVPLMELCRFSIGPDTSPAEFEEMLVGVS